MDYRDQERKLNTPTYRVAFHDPADDPRNQGLQWSTLPVSVLGAISLIALVVCIVAVLSQVL